MLKNKLFDKRSINPLFERQIVNLDTDKFYQELTQEQKDYLLDTLKYHTEDNHNNENYKWHGDVQYCPRCKKIRITDCCACGCGHCYTCDYRFSCNSGFNFSEAIILNDKSINLKPIIN